MHLAAVGSFFSGKAVIRNSTNLYLYPPVSPKSVKKVITLFFVENHLALIVLLWELDGPLLFSLN